MSADILRTSLGHKVLLCAPFFSRRLAANSSCPLTELKNETRDVYIQRVSFFCVDVTANPSAIRSDIQMQLGLKGKKKEKEQLAHNRIKCFWNEILSSRPYTSHPPPTFTTTSFKNKIRKTLTSQGLYSYWPIIYSTEYRVRCHQNKRTWYQVGSPSSKCEEYSTPFAEKW